MVGMQRQRFDPPGHLFRHEAREDALTPEELGLNINDADTRPPDWSGSRYSNFGSRGSDSGHIPNWAGSQSGRTGQDHT